MGRRGPGTLVMTAETLPAKNIDDDLFDLPRRQPHDAENAKRHQRFRRILDVVHAPLQDLQALHWIADADRQRQDHQAKLIASWFKSLAARMLTGTMAEC